MATATWSYYLSSYTPAMATHDNYDDLTNEVTGTAYTAGGQALAAKTLTATTANSWATTWAASTAYVVGDVVRPTVANTFLYQCVVAGTSAGSQPTWPTTRGLSVADNTATWLCAGTGILVFDANDPSWASSTISNARYGAVYKNTGTAGTSTLIGLLTFSADVSSSSGTLSIPLHATLGMFYEFSG
jgi:hypothetical protein